MIKLNEAGIICMLIFGLIGCDQGRRMIHPVIQESSPTLEEPPVEFPTVQEVEFAVDDVTHTTGAFTTEKAAFESTQFQEFLEYAREYNAEWCGQIEKPFGDVRVDELKTFQFTNELAAAEFLSQAPQRYPNYIKNRENPLWSLIPATDKRPWWSITLSARCE